jgi:hypothetical protein
MRVTENKLVPVAAGLFLACAAASAHADGPGGSYIQGAYADWDDFDDGFNIAGSFMVAPVVRIFGEFTNTDLEHLRIGAGYVFPMDNAEVELGASYHRFDVGPFDDDGIGVHVGGRVAITEEFRLAGKIEYVFLDDFDDETIVGIDAEFRFTPEFSIFAGFDFYDEADNLLKVGARFHF